MKLNGKAFCSRPLSELLNLAPCVYNEDVSDQLTYKPIVYSFRALEVGNAIECPTFQLRLG